MLTQTRNVTSFTSCLPASRTLWIHLVHELSVSSGRGRLLCECDLSDSYSADLHNLTGTPRPGTTGTTLSVVAAAVAASASDAAAHDAGCRAACLPEEGANQPNSAGAGKLQVSTTSTVPKAQPAEQS